MNEAGAYTNWAVDEQSNYGNDIEQFGQLLATLLGHCHGSSEYTQVNIVQFVSLLSFASFCGGNLPWTSIPYMGSSNTPSRFML